MAKPVAQRGSARGRVIDAALQLFAEHGVHGASLQMIADELGVTKAAVYYQFHSKDDIVLAVIQPIFDDLSRIIRIAAALSTPTARRDAVVSGLVETSITHRGVMAVFAGDPVVHTLVQSHAEFSRISDALTDLVTGAQHDTLSRIAGSMVTTGIFGASTDPRLADVTDDELRTVLSECSRHLLALSVVG